MMKKKKMMMAGESDKLHWKNINEATAILFGRMRYQFSFTGGPVCCSHLLKEEIYNSSKFQTLSPQARHTCVLTINAGLFP